MKKLLAKNPLSAKEKTKITGALRSGNKSILPFLKSKRPDIFEIHSENRIGWFRIFNFGLKWKYVISFSERYGYKKSIKFLGWRFTILTFKR